MGRTYVVPATSALVASTAKTLILLAPVVTQCLTEMDLSFDSNTVQPAALVELYRTTTLGSPTGTAFTPVKVNSPGDAAASTTALINLTAEPTAVEILRHWLIQPYGGRVGPLQFPLGREPIGSLATTQRIGLRVTSGAASTPTARAYIEFEE